MTHLQVVTFLILLMGQYNYQRKLFFEMPQNTLLNRYINRELSKSWVGGVIVVIYKSERDFETIVELIGERIRMIFDTDDPNLQDHITVELEVLISQLDNVCVHYGEFLQRRRENIKIVSEKYLRGYPFRKS